ncbi:sugar phosphate nucleotidyltransferase [Desulfitobacterium chlororespirans]|uniref:Mannose-1-phosphate guanylyltransferase n=1 Tax=Desulfitobacterium chlororespirans DSM 11544 TaxID=1121395 RepID=A0A1M7UVI3_9FIRM|nr:sugar phosphate nucleotidyltransferase [Desulfitobacterium chlororespirans]SHN86974.1 mannose-1-phosphate guanylyltransferase [Desulfitobacterium chlororespirans DSM 11544]
MQLILLSGGAGKRLWPISNPARPKQFIKLLQNQEGRVESMAQRVWRQLQAKGLASSTLIVCCEPQTDNLISQLSPEIKVVCEPEQRDTFPAIALACSHLHTQENLNPDEAVIVAPIDTYAAENFFDNYRKLAQLLTEEHGEVGLIGITPTSPSSSFGYMVPSSGPVAPDFLRIERFVEKPKPEAAAKIIKDGALWNSGVFAFKLGFILNWLKSHRFPTQYEDLRHCYSSLPRTSFDYEVLENSSQIIAVKYDGYWLDIGTWKTITPILPQIIGKGAISPDSVNTHIINELDIPILTLGTLDIVVAAGPDGILVADKDSSPRLKDFTGDYPNRPRYEERRWGWYYVLDHSKSLDGYEILTKKLHLHHDKCLSYQVHGMRTEVWTITSGNGLFACDGKIYPVKSGDVLHIPGGTKHGLKAISDLELIEVQSGINLIEEDITRIYLFWQEVVEHCVYVEHYY